MDRLYYRKKQVSLLFALIAVVLIVLFGELPDTSLYWQEIQNTGHTVMFAVVAVLVLLLLKDSFIVFQPASLKLYAAACLVSLLLAVLTEFVQLWIGSDFSTADIIRDSAGIITGLGLSVSNNSHQQPLWLKSRQKIKAGIMVLTVFVFAVSLVPLARLSVSYVQRNEAFPVILDLSERWVEPFIQTKNAVITSGVSRQTSAGDNATRSVLVQLNAGTYPGISMIELYPDWSSFEKLTLKIYSEQVKPFELVVRVHDEQHNNDYVDRFNKRLVVKAGENYFQIPLKEIEYATAGRKMDMKKVNTLIIFANEVTVPLRFFMRAVRLE